MDFYDNDEVEDFDEVEEFDTEDSEETEDAVDETEEVVEEVVDVVQPVLTTTKNLPYPGVETISFGKNNESIKAMQERLNQKGFRVVAGATGEYEETTVAAVSAYCASIGIRGASGHKIGPKAWGFLFAGE